MASLTKRGKVYYARYWLGKKQRQVCLHTKSYPMAKEKLRQLESSLAQGAELPLPSKTPVSEVLTAYVGHIWAAKTKNTAKSELYYLRDIFGPICPELQPAGKPARKTRQDEHLEARCFESITTAQIVQFILNRMRDRGLSPKTCNHYRAILSRLFSWAMSQYGIKLPGDTNPASKVERYRERSRTIRFLSLPQIEEQLKALTSDPLIQTMVALYIYAGLRREEALWLTRKDINLRAGKHGVIYVQAKTIDGEFWQPKTRVNRVVPISTTLRSYLDRYKLRIVPGGWYFPSPHGKRWNPDNLSADLRTLNKEAGLIWGCLDFRHSFGSHLAMKGESLYKIATLMGNSPEICRRHYAALLPESLVDSVEFTSAPSEQGAPPTEPKPKLYILPKPGDGVE